MAKGDIIIRTKLETSQYDQNIAKMKRQLEGFTDANYTAGGVMKQMTSQLVATAAKFATLSAAAAGAMKVVRDAFMSSESNADQWASTMAAAESVYQSFVQSLNNASFSGFLSNIDEVVKAARNAYNAMDELGTRMTVINPERTRLQARATELRATIRREGADSEAGRAAQAALKALEPALQKSFKTESQLNMNAFEAAVDKKLAEGGIKLDKDSRAFLLRTFSSDEAFNRLRAGARGGITAGTTIGGTTSMTIGSRDTRNTNAKLMDLFTDEWRAQYAPLLSAAYGARGSAASAMLGNARYLREGGGGGGGRGGRGAAVEYTTGGISGTSIMSGVGFQVDNSTKSLARLNEELKRWQGLMDRATTATDYNRAAIGVASTQKRIKAQDSIMALGIDTEQQAEIQAEMEAFGDKLRDSIKPITIEVEGGDDLPRLGKEVLASWQEAAGAISTASGALASLDNPSAKIAGLVGQAVANIALGFAQAAASPATTMAGVWGWIAAAVSGLATMTATIASIKNVTAGSYAEGGIVPGNNHSDGLIAAVSSGELILNAAQQNNLASRLQGGGGGGSAQPFVTGETVYLGLNNYLRRSGRGEIVTTGR